MQPRPSIADKVSGIALNIATTLQLVLTVAVGTIAGTMIVGGLLGTLASLAGLDQVVGYAAPVGWVLGGVIGFFSERSLWRRKSSADSQSKSSNSEPVRYRFKIPSPKDGLSYAGFGASFGLIFGIAGTVFLFVMLISVTTSPFVPDQWRPTTSAPDPEDLDRDERLGRRRDGLRTNFQHPLMWPIAYYTTTSFVVLGMIGGTIGGCWEPVRDVSTSSLPMNKENPEHSAADQCKPQ